MNCLSTFLIYLLLCLISSAQQPFCGYNTARNSISIILSCETPNAFINNIQFCSYGTPSVLDTCKYAINNTCHFQGSLRLAQKACLNQTECVITADGSVPDPCPNAVKSLAVVATCSEGSGKSEIITLACSLTSNTPACPLPQWQPTYQINRSTICQPGNTQKFLNATEAARWGLVSLDWSIASDIWYTGSEMNATGASTLVEQARQIKLINPSTKVFVYRNAELALSWLEPQRNVMFDPNFASFFLQYQANNPGNFTPGVIYNEPAGAPCANCAQYFTNFSSADAFEYFLSVSEQGEYGTSSPYVDGTFLDDSQAIPQEHSSAPYHIGLTPIQLFRLQNATYRYVDQVISTLAAKGKYVWQGFDNAESGDPDLVAPGPSQASCVSYMQRGCDPSWQTVPMTMQWPSAQNDKLPSLAAFLITRGPIAYLGYGWNGGPLPAWDSLWDAYDVGAPVGLCATPKSGVFARNYTKGYAVLDCNLWAASMHF